MHLRELLAGIKTRASWGEESPLLSGLHYDSRQIQPGNAFVAIRGEQVDGNRFVGAAQARGAVAVLSEAARPVGHNGVWVQVEDGRRALASAAANWFGQPSRQLRLVGITGTNGKTTTAFLCESLLRSAGWHTGLLGTIEYHVGDAVFASPHTTPESYDLQQLFRSMVDAGCGAAVLEVSSHALAMERVWTTAFEVAIFTNLTQDHLDFHGTMAAYGEAKRRLFTGTGAAPPRHAVVNADDAAAEAMVRGFPGRIWRFGFGSEAELQASALRQTPQGIAFRLRGPGGWEAEIASPLLGRVNALNLLAAMGAGLALGLDREQVIAGVCNLPRVPGRFERVYAGQPFTVVVDYAHTPDALRNLLAMARELVGGDGRVITLFGCGGDRDRGKRPLMGRAAGAGSDLVVLTSDNPRSEDPLEILAQARAGLEGATTPLHVEVDRRAAIRYAIGQARRGDIVVLAGKGHEDYQIVGEQKLHFDDREEALAALTAGGGA